MERNTPHNLIALTAMTRLSEMGVDLVLQQRIGAFVVCWGLYEAHLEGALWALTGEEVKGNRPSTDKMPVSEWFEVLGKGSEHLSAAANEVLALAAEAADNLLGYRNSLVHGVLIPFPGAVSFLRNPRWNGEERKRESGDAHVDENLLDMAIEASWILFRLVVCMRPGPQDPDVCKQIEGMGKDIRRAKSFANELRHLTALMNHEKY